MHRLDQCITRLVPHPCPAGPPTGASPTGLGSFWEGFSIFEPGFFGTSSWLSLAWADYTCPCPHVSEPHSLCEGYLHPPSHQVGNFQALWDICLLFPTACHQAHSPSNNSGVHPLLFIPPGWWLSSVLIPPHLDFLASSVSSQQGLRKRRIGVGESVGLCSDLSSSP
uniref:Uncharacterized protein n=1 Tax=Myotis myotis TaxID=51298 RepID=A0A7J7ZX30_MYOMY|nr:hypothetical protein mMyoMyo1_009650 [Myotis myotis]